MDDSHPEVITVRLGGKDRRLKLGPAAFRLAELIHDTTITNADLSDPQIAFMPRLVWIGLLPDEPDLTERDVLVWLASADDESEALAAAARALKRTVDALTRAMSDTPKKKK